jgi:phenylacetate-CoA ligase
MTTEPKFWNEKAENISQDKLMSLRMEKLSKQLEYCYKNAFYKEKFREAGFEPGDIKTWGDFRKIPPLMNKEIERQSRDESLKKYNHPIGMHLCSSLTDVIGAYHTSGTTGMPTFSYTFTKHDLDVWCEGFHRMFWRWGVRPADRVMFALGTGTYVTNSILTALERYGVLLIPVGAEGGTKRVIEYTQLFRANVLICTPSYAEYLLEKAPSIAGMEASELGFEKVVVCGEPGFGIPSLRRKLLDGYQCKMYEFWVPMAEGYACSCDSKEYAGMHEVAPDYSIYADDLIDPETREPIDIKDGAIGEGVVTSLERYGLPLVKYALGDIVQVFSSPCECGYPGIRVKVIGRSDDLLIVKGVNIYPSAIRDVVNSFIPEVTGALKIVLQEKPPRVSPPLRLKVEFGEKTDKNNLEELEKKIKERMHEKRVTPSIEWVPPGSLGRSEKKTQLFEKVYEE